MKKLINAMTPAGDIIEKSVQELKTRVASVELHLRKSCADALIGGLHLMYLRQNMPDDSPASPCVPRGTHGEGGKFNGAEKGTGFKAILAEVGLKKTTAYRWMSAARTALYRLGHCDMANVMPAPESPTFGELEDGVCRIAEGVSLSRLLVGAGDQGDMMRLESITTRMETSETDEERAIYEEALENVESGKWSLAQAMCAIGSREAAEVAKERRANIVYCDIDPASGNLVGPLPKALVTLANGLRHWPDLPEPARNKFRAEWKTLVSQLPADF